MKTHTRHNSKLLKRVFGGLPVVDAKRELRLFSDVSDISVATRKDPTNCVFAKTCQRLYGSHNVAFFRTVAYVDLPDSKGGRRIERFNLTKMTRKLIEKFDRTGRADPAGYHLIAPSPGFTMDHRLAKSREYLTTKMQTAVTAKKKTKHRIIAEVRNGKGLVQFIGGPKDWVRQK